MLEKVYSILLYQIMQPAELEGTRMRVLDIGLPDRGVEWKPDVAMSQPFTRFETSIMQAFWDGAHEDDIASILSIPDWKVRESFKLTISDKIQKAVNFDWDSENSFQKAIWMYKHKFLRRETISFSTQIPKSMHFSENGLWIAREFLSGLPMNRGLIQTVRNGNIMLLSDSIIKNYFNGGKSSLADKIQTIRGTRPAHRLAACVWLVQNGYIAENVIGERLP